MSENRHAKLNLSLDILRSAAATISREVSHDQHLTKARIIKIKEQAAYLLDALSAYDKALGDDSQ